MNWKWFYSPDDTVCELHRRKPPYKEEFYADKGHSGCPICQGFRDQRVSNHISQSHQIGKHCKHANQCSECCSIKSITLKLRHYGGCCNRKKCQFCKIGLKYYDDSKDFWSVYNRKALDIRWLYKSLVK